MKLTGIQLSNLRSYDDSGYLAFGPVTLLVGRNNSGKSTILRALSAMQDGMPVTADAMVRFGASDGQAILYLAETADRGLADGRPEASDGNLNIIFSRSQDESGGHINGTYYFQGGRQAAQFGRFPGREPGNYIYPYFSNRRTTTYQPDVSSGSSFSVGADLSNLPAKVDRLGNPANPAYAEFSSLIAEVIGLPVSAVGAVAGKQVGLYLTSTDTIPLDRLGDGVAQLLGLIVQLTDARGKLFLIEELENDVHPQALKAILDVIEKKSASNQFVISTHNNIVLRHLGALADTKIYDLRSTAVDHESVINLTRTEAIPVGDSVEERTALLEWLGYELSDLYLFDGWLIFEESSAERVAREFLIPRFAPGLLRVRTVAANGTGDLSRTFGALNKLVLYTHLQDRYQGRTMVVADGDPSGIEAIANLSAAYPSWDAEDFKTFSKGDFELYYPARFEDEVGLALAEPDVQRKRALKRNLLSSVLEWIRGDEGEAEREFASSAAEVITLLQQFEARFS